MRLPLLAALFQQTGCLHIDGKVWCVPFHTSLQAYSGQLVRRQYGVTYGRWHPYPGPFNSSGVASCKRYAEPLHHQGLNLHLEARLPHPDQTMTSAVTQPCMHAADQAVTRCDKHRMHLTLPVACSAAAVQHAWHHGPQQQLLRAHWRSMVAASTAGLVPSTVPVAQLALAVSGPHMSGPHRGMMYCWEALTQTTGQPILEDLARVLQDSTSATTCYQQLHHIVKNMAAILQLLHYGRDSTPLDLHHAEGISVGFANTLHPSSGSCAPD